ncbi:MAG: radical SAM family heme chaperone HemW [Bacteroidia bacterium]
MAGIYIHIPFCRKACFYCDFHFSVSMKTKSEVLEALSNEIFERKGLIKDEVVESIYFGGGTPSVLSRAELEGILSRIHDSFIIKQDAEVTFECNPDDLNPEYLQNLFDAGINRLSIGIQSFNDKHLKWMNRSHNNDQSIQCISDAAAIGFKDITIDLIYGIPQMSTEEWVDTVKKALQMPVNHLSAYSLTLEENTPYHKLVTQEKYMKPNDDLASEHFNKLVDIATEYGWEHYEVSNFCKVGNYSKHNTSYWQNKKYLGLGPSAHSFDHECRYWNVSSNKEYVRLSQENKPTYEKEILSGADRLNEVLLTGLRTKWGVDLDAINDHFQYDIKSDYKNEIEEWDSNGWLRLVGSRLILSSTGLLFADYIASELFLLETV